MDRDEDPDERRAPHSVPFGRTGLASCFPLFQPLSQQDEKQ